MTRPTLMDVKRFRRLALTTAVTTLVLTALGALVRATDSGLGCLDEWPTCAGGWIAPLELHALVEYTHRLVAGVVVLLVLALVVGARRWMRPERVYLGWTLGAFAVVLGQAWLGQVVVTTHLHGAYVTAHFTLAVALVAITTGITAAAYMHGRPPATGSQRRVFGLAMGALGGLVPLLLVGAYVRERGAGLAFADWPLMGGSLIPSFDHTIQLVQFLHRLLALLVLGHLIGLAMRVRTDARGAVRLFGLAGVGLFVVQVFVGAANVWTLLSVPAVLAHSALSHVTWAAFIALAVVSRRGRPPLEGTATAGGGGGVADRISAYVALTKPRIIILLLVTTVPAMVLAQRGLPPLWLIGATLLGGMLTAGSANAINQYLERDIDSKMQRTRSRPLPRHAVEPTRALVFAVAVGVAGFVWLAVVVNLLAASLAAGAILFYVFVYTVWLKRSTPQNIVIGGAAGAMPVLIGWAAVTGTIEPPAWAMFAIIFVWTPPHFWALAVRYREDYAGAEVPMMPVVRGVGETAAQILAYSVVLVVVTLSMSVIGGLGALYAAVALVLGLGFVYRAARLRIDQDGASALKLFRYSTSYLALLFTAMAVDQLVW